MAASSFGEALSRLWPRGLAKAQARLNSLRAGPVNDQNKLRCIRSLHSLPFISTFHMLGVYPE
jgi:hypothetical protein